MTALANLPPDLGRERLLNVKQAAEFLSVSLSTVRRMYRKGQMPAPIMIGSRKLAWRLSVLLAFLESREGK